jgi:hypothetical protein
LGSDLTEERTVAASLRDARARLIEPWLQDVFGRDRRLVGWEQSS